MAGYTFGGDEQAAERLALVAAAYRPVSWAFLGRHAPTDVGRAVDLGCGPGFTTALVREATRAATVTGVDSAPDFLAVARARVPEATFVQHDVSEIPLPGAPADLIYARLLLAHLTEPVRIAAQWSSQLRPGGRMLIEDLENIVAPPGALRDYDDLSARIVQAAGGVMYAGASLAALGGSCTPVTVPAAVAARIYLFNVRRWLLDPPTPASGAELGDLERRLAGVAADRSDDTVSWMVRQIVITT